MQDDVWKARKYSSNHNGAAKKAAVFIAARSIPLPRSVRLIPVAVSRLNSDRKIR